MKTICHFLIVAIYINGYGQTTRPSHNKINRAKFSKNNTNGKRVYNQSGDNNTTGQPGETVTETSTGKEVAIQVLLLVAFTLLGCRRKIRHSKPKHK